MGELGCKGYGCIVGGLLALAGILLCILLPFSLHTIEEGKNIQPLFHLHEPAWLTFPEGKIEIVFSICLLKYQFDK